MVVQHNMQAMNANRMLGVTTSAQAKSTEKLSSGYKINRAADDAAGLTISEKMRKQIRGLDRASTNAQDGVSAVQTAEGALTEVHSMLQRMNELATQASNGTNSESDRDAIQAEIDQLATEIDRVAETTKFNETYLLKGDRAGTTSDVKINAHDAGLKGKLTDKGDTAIFQLNKELENGDKVTIAGTEYTIGNKATTDSTDGYAVYNDVKSATLQAGDTITYIDGNGDEKTATMANKVANATATYATGAKFVVTDENGHELNYEVAAAAAAGGKVTAADAVDIVTKALEDGHKVTMTLDKTGGTVVDWEIVGALEDGEVGANIWTAATGDTVDEFAKLATANGGLGLTLTAGQETDELKSVTLGGEKTVITAAPPISSADVAEAMGKLKAGDQIMINGDGAGAGTLIKIADKTDIQNGEYTIEDALKAINVEEGDVDTVAFFVQDSNKDGLKALKDKGLANHSDAGVPDFAGANAAWTPNSVAGSPSGDGKADGKILTASEAYAKIAEELKKASSIGADEGKEATVTNNGNGKFTIEKGSAEVTDSLSFNLHVGADADMTNKITVNLDSMDAASLGIKGLNVTDDTGIDATYAIDAIADAISKVSAQRSALGAVQNRLEHTIANLDNVVENTTAAESRIRDTDMAEQMVEYSKNNILAQAGQSMLAQANQSTQGVLSLLG